MTAATLEPAPIDASRARVRVVAIVAATVGVVACSLALAWPWSEYEDMAIVGPVLVLVAAYLVTGSMIALRQPRNALGWVLTLVAFFFAVLTVTGGPGPRLEESRLRLWLSVLFSGWWAPPIFTLLSVVPLIFPNGTLPSRRWRLVIWAAAFASFATVISSPFDPAAVGPPLQNPIANKALYDALGLGTVIGMISIVCAMVGMARRYRRAHGVERDQMKLLVTSVVIAVMSMVLNAVLITIIGEEDVPAFIEAGLLIFSATVLCLGIGVAILRHRLFDINVVISKTLVYASLALVVTGVYVTFVVGIGALAGRGDEPNLGLSIAATAVAALAFQPLRTRAQRLANRLVYGRRATPYEILSHLSEQLRETYANEDVLAHMARSMAEGTGATQARVWIRTGDMLWTAASWPAGLPRLETRAGDSAIDATLTVPVEHGGERLGALSITKPANDPLTATEERLMTDLGTQAGLVLRNARLTQELMARLEDLKASRQRLVKAQDEERRRLERDLHDGAQQMLVALKVQLGLATSLAEDDSLKQMLQQLAQQTGEALETLRELARGIYPPLLASSGLASAIGGQAQRAIVPVEVEADGIGRYSPEIEAAAYFCVLEALQNVQKYAAATRVVVRLAEGDGTLRFEVIDDGRGFDPATTARGSGTQNMADRLGALDGTVEVRSTPGAGTAVIGSIPLPVHGLMESSRA